MTGPLRVCGRADCRLCHPEYEHERDPNELANALLGMAAIVLLFAVVFLILPVMT